MKVPGLLLIHATSAMLSLASAFTSPLPRVAARGRVAHFRALSDVTPMRPRGFASLCEMASDGSGEVAGAEPPRKRRKRKDGKQFSPATAAESDADAVDDADPEPEDTADQVVPTAPKENVVVMQVRDIRDVVSGVPEPEPPVAEVVVEYDDDEDEELADDEEWEYYDVDEDGNEIIVSEDEGDGRVKDDSLEQLLADARRMRASSSAATSDGQSQMTDGEDGSSMKDTIFEVISTIVTIDFFVVIGLLVWFLAGIFCSTVLGNDAVQIAFNMNFERVTQP